MALTNTDLHFVKLARLQGERASYSHKKRGAVLANQNRIIAVGVNSHLDSGNEAPSHAGSQGSEERYVATLNAEIVAISSAIRQNISLHGATVYISDEPNWVTFKFLVAVGIKRIVHYGPTQNEHTKHYAQKLGVEIISVG